MEDRNLLNNIQNIYLENREYLKITGVEQVESFNENIIEVYTTKGAINIKGSNMHINKLNVDDGTLKIEGKIDSIIYSNKSASTDKKGFFKKIFK